MKLKDKILAELLIHKNEHISGGTLASRYGVSRTAIWKVIEQLKADGCNINAVTNRGYRLLEMPDLFCQPYLEELLKDSSMDWSIQYYEKVDSTNRIAKELAGHGAPAGTLIVADEQEGGKGRMGRSFYSPPGGLYMSMILRPDLPLSDMMAVTAAVASAVHYALASFGIQTQIKWVNDLYLNGRKLCGILTEGSFNAELLKMDYIVIGIGLNMRHDPNVPEMLVPILTDLESECGTFPQRCELIAEILKYLTRLIDDIGERSFLPIYTKNSYTIGKKVRVQGKNGLCTALAVGYADDAGLIVEHEDGQREVIRTGSAEILL